MKKAWLFLFTLALSLSVPALSVDTGFRDVSADAYYAEAVHYVREHGLMNGTSTVTFDPAAAISRAQLTAILWRQAGSPAAGSAAFSDVPGTAYYADAAAWASEQGIVTGHPDGRFAPNDPVTRAQLAALLWRAAGSPAVPSQTAFADQSAIPSYAVSAAVWARAGGMISGKDGNRFDPNGSATRAQTAAVLYRYLSREDQREPDVGQIQITTESGGRIVFELNASTAANALYHQLPFTATVENYGRHEKIFYPPEKLNPGDAPLAKGSAGALTYYAPWGDVAVFYGDFDGADGLYALGQAVSGAEHLADLSGEITVEAVAPNTAFSETNAENDAVTKIQVRVGDRTFTATLAQNEAAGAFVKMLQNAPVSIQMSDYSGFEKVGALGSALPAEDSRTTTAAGDIVLYSGNQIVMFYGPHSWSYTRLGKIDDLTGWKDALGGGDVRVTFQLP